jgi:uncharacterized membrane protein YbhN (UPF0104 family)
LALRAEHRRLALRAIQWTIAALVLAFLIREVLRSWNDLAARSYRFHPGWLLLAAGCYLAGLAPCAWFWYQTLRAAGQRPPLLATLRAYFVGHLGKYVPGKALVVVLRAGMLRSAGADVRVAAISVFYETLTMMAVGAFLAAAALLLGMRQHPAMALLAAGLMLVALLPTLPPVFRPLVRWAGAAGGDPTAAARLDRLGYRNLALGWLAIGGGWLLVAASLWATLRAMDVPQAADSFVALLEQLPWLTASVALSVVAGFLSLLPGGALVRESVLYVLLQEPLGNETALVAAVVLRLVWLASEVIVAGGLWLLPEAAARCCRRP